MYFLLIRFRKTKDLEKMKTQGRTRGDTSPLDLSLGENISSDTFVRFVRAFDYYEKTPHERGLAP